MKLFLTRCGNNMDIWRERELVREGQTYTMRVFHMKRVSGEPLTPREETSIKDGKWAAWMNGTIIAESDSLEELIYIATVDKL